MNKHEDINKLGLKINMKETIVMKTVEEDNEELVVKMNRG